MLASKPVGAQLYDTGATCRNIFDAMSILKGKYSDKGAMLHLCLLKNGDIYSATASSAPRKNALSICAVTSEDVTAQRRKDGSYIEPPDDPLPQQGYTVTTWMTAPTDGACPRQDDDSYLYAQGTPDGVFLALLDIWKTIRKEPSSFKGLLALDKPDRSSADSFEKTINDPAILSRLVLTGIKSDTTATWDKTTDRSAVFILVIHDKSDW